MRDEGASNSGENWSDLIASSYCIAKLALRFRKGREPAHCWKQGALQWSLLQPSTVKKKKKKKRFAGCFCLIKKLVKNYSNGKEETRRGLFERRGTRRSTHVDYFYLF